MEFYCTCWNIFWIFWIWIYIDINTNIYIYYKYDRISFDKILLKDTRNFYFSIIFVYSQFIQFI